MGVESALLSIIAPRLQWLHEQLLHICFTCPQPDVPEAEVRPALHSQNVNAGGYFMQKSPNCSVLVRPTTVSAIIDTVAV